MNFDIIYFTLFVALFFLVDYIVYINFLYYDFSVKKLNSENFIYEQKKLYSLHNNKFIFIKPKFIKNNELTDFIETLSNLNFEFNNDNFKSEFNNISNLLSFYLLKFYKNESPTFNLYCLLKENKNLKKYHVDLNIIYLEHITKNIENIKNNEDTSFEPCFLDYYFQIPLFINQHFSMKRIQKSSCVSLINYFESRIFYSSTLKPFIFNEKEHLNNEFINSNPYILQHKIDRF